MKILQKPHCNPIYTSGRDPEIYDVQLAHHDVALIDREENIIDVFPRCMLRFTLPEAKALVEAMKTQWPDYSDDVYYGQGEPIYPIIAPPRVHDDLEFTQWQPGILLYRYQVAGEWVYGITNRMTEDAPPERYVETSMNGWEKWYDDHRRAIENAWLARYS